MWHEVLQFWFEEIEPSKWWEKNAEFDNEIKQRFLPLHQQAVKCELFHWRDSAAGRLAEIIVLDQFSRNIYRDTPLSFSYDALALVLAQQIIGLGLDQQLPVEQRGFCYLPFMHSESAVIHKQAVALYEALGNQQSLAFELKHKRIIDRFGRYPHRNLILGRETTAEEQAFLLEPDSSF